MKITKIVLIASLLLFIILLCIYIFSGNEKEESLSKREQYQQELINEQTTE